VHYHRVAADLVGRADRHDLAVIECDDAVRHAHQRRHVVLGEHDAVAAAAQAREQPGLADEDVQARGETRTSG
jgi:hypothetical protein